MNHYFTNNNIESNLKEIVVNLGGKSFIFNTDNGVFSKRGLDFGSRTLLDALLSVELSGKCLDVGCGYGAIGIILSSFFDLKMDMIDINKRAIHLSSMNVKKNGVFARVFYSDVYDNVDEKYDVIVTNPPIRAGKDIVYKILFGAKNYLKSSGVLYCVVNKNQGAKSILNDLNDVGVATVIKKNKGFYVIRCIFD